MLLSHEAHGGLEFGWQAIVAPKGTRPRANRHRVLLALKALHGFAWQCASRGRRIRACRQRLRVWRVSTKTPEVVTHAGAAQARGVHTKISHVFERDRALVFLREHHFSGLVLHQPIATDAPASQETIIRHFDYAAVSQGHELGA